MPRQPRSEMPQEKLREMFDYQDGKLVWKIRPCRNIFPGHVVGSGSTKRYRLQVFIGNKPYAAHRVIYAMHHGVWPEAVDHINGDECDNRIENLRAATFLQNTHNRKISSRNPTGFKGVGKRMVHGRPRFRVVVTRPNAKKKEFNFEDFELACLVSEEAQRLYHGEFAVQGERLCR